MSSEPKFIWGAQKNGPKGYPVEILSGTLFFKGEEKGLYVPDGPSDGTWGKGFADHMDIEHSLPNRLEVTFYSYFENQTYHGVFDLPYEKMVDLYQWGKDNPLKRLKLELLQFKKIVVGVAPGGTVAVWIRGPAEQREILFAKAEKIERSLSSVFQVPFTSKEDGEEFRLKVLKQDVGDEHFQKVMTDGIPFDIWQRYRKEFPWKIVGNGKLAFTDIHANHVNGFRSHTTYDYSTVIEAPVPRFIKFYHGPKFYEITFDAYETITAFETLATTEGLTPEEALIHIEVTPKLPKETSSVRIYNAKHSIELNKATYSAK